MKLDWRKAKMLIGLLGMTAFIAGGEGDALQTRALAATQHVHAGSFYTGHYPNLFLQDHQTPAAVQAKVMTAWRQLFHGDPTSETVYYPIHSGMAYIYDTGNLDVRTEGMGYGMMIAVQLNHPQEFNALWKFAKTYMQNTSGPDRYYFAWHTDKAGNVLDPGPAPDGDSWIVTALLFASDRWGNGKGIDNYLVQARHILHAMVHQTANEGTDMFDPTTHLPVFSPDGASDFTDPSYNLPAFYRIWALADPADAQFWNASARASEAFFQQAASKRTGLTPDYATFNGTPTGADPHTNFEYDAWRTIANASVDWTWFAADPWEHTYANTLEKFFYKQGINNCGNLYSLNGQQLGPDHSTGLVAMNAASALAATIPQRGDFVDALWNTPIPTGQYRYYDGMLYMLGLLYVSGEFRIWYPHRNSGRH